MRFQNKLRKCSNVLLCTSSKHCWSVSWQASILNSLRWRLQHIFPIRRTRPFDAFASPNQSTERCLPNFARIAPSCWKIRWSKLGTVCILGTASLRSISRYKMLIEAEFVMTWAPIVYSQDAHQTSLSMVRFEVSGPSELSLTREDACHFEKILLHSSRSAFCIFKYPVRLQYPLPLIISQIVWILDMCEVK